MAGTRVSAAARQQRVDLPGDGGDLDEVSGKRCTLQGFPWRWYEGDACVIRLVAMLDRSGEYRLETGTAG